MQDISPFVEECRAKHDLVALGGLVIADGKIAAIGAAGERKRGSGVKVTVRDKWHVGSCGKAMTATVIARLIERGKLSWSGTMGDLSGSLGPMRTEYRNVTVTELLQMRGGLVSMTDPTSPSSERVWTAVASAGDDLGSQRDAAARSVLLEEPEVPRGVMHYSNAGYTLLGVMAEHATGASWERLMADELFGPLGMASTGFGAPGTPSLIDEPLPHREEGEKVVPVESGQSDNLPFLSPVGRVHCSLEDWSRFVRAHLDGASGSTDYLSAESWERLHAAPPGSPYAMGWIIMEDAWAGAMWRHTGSNGMNYAEINVSPSKKWAVLQVRNESRPRASDILLAEGMRIGKHLTG